MNYHELKLISFIKRSKQREKVLACFHSSHTPTEISEKTNLSPSHISRTLREFCEKKLLKCQNVKSHVGKLYTLTRTGKQIQALLEGEKVAEKYSK